MMDAIAKLEDRIQQLETERNAMQYALGSVVDILGGFVDRLDILLKQLDAPPSKQQGIRDQLDRLRDFCRNRLVDTALKEWEDIQQVIKLSTAAFTVLAKLTPDLSDEEVDSTITLFESFIENKEGTRWQTLKEKLLKQRASGEMPPKSLP